MSMMSPSAYREMHKYDSLQKLIAERHSLLSRICRYEDEMMFHKSQAMSPILSKPSSKTIYWMHNEYLKEITDLIIAKHKDAKI